MTLKTAKMITLVLLPTLIALASGPFTPKGPDTSPKATVIEFKNGAMVVDTVTLKFVGGATNQLNVGSTVNLARVKLGDEVTVPLAEALAITITKL